MNPRKVSAFWQQVAHRESPPDSAFAIADAIGNSNVAPAFVQICTDGGHDCYPFPSPWSDPAWVGPFFQTAVPAFGRSCAICVMPQSFWFVFAGLAVESSSITTNNRGRKSSCVKPFFFLHFFRCRWLAACKTLLRAGLRVLRQGRLWPTLPITTPLPVRLLAVWRGLRPAASMWVCRPAIDLKFVQAGPSAANWIPKTIQRSSGDIPRLAAFAFLTANLFPQFGKRRSASHV